MLAIASVLAAAAPASPEAHGAWVKQGAKAER